MILPLCWNWARTTQPSYIGLDQDETRRDNKHNEHSLYHTQPLLSRSAQLVHSHKYKLSGLLGGLLVASFLLHSSSPELLGVSRFQTDSTDQAHRTFHLIFPANEINPNVCKVLLSTVLLGYPAPTIINYNQTFGDSVNTRYGAAGSHVAKSAGTARYLRSLPSGSENDLVILVDGYDAWFQLRPEVLLERYHDVVRRADDRTMLRFGPRATEVENIRQRVLFSAQKLCSPLQKGDPGCEVVPLTTLPDGLYGPKTDEVVGFGAQNNPDRYFRNRFLNSGAAAGTPAAMLDVFSRAQEYASIPAHDHGGSDQGIIADVWTEQEIHRNIVQARLQGKDVEEVPFSALVASEDGKNYELGIGVDYESQLVLATNNHDQETAYVHYADPGIIAELSAAIGMHQPRVGSLPDDIARSRPPFQSASGSMGWEDIPLFTNLRTGVTPVVIHLNEWRNNAKERLNTTWSDVWFQPFAKAMFEDATKRRQMSRAGNTLVELPMGVAYEYMAGGGRIKTDNGEDFAFEDVCGSAYDVLFADQTQIM